MNKEAIERTKARCKKEIRGKDRIYVLPGFYVKKQKDATELDETVDYEGVMLNGKRFFVSGLNNNATVNPREAGLIVPRADYIPELNSWFPLNRQELYTLLGVATGMIILGVYFL